MKKYLVFFLIFTTYHSFAQRLLKDIASGTGNAGIFASGTFSSNDTLFFRADAVNELGYNYQYYLTTGNENSTKKLKYDAMLFFESFGGHIYFKKFNNKVFLANYGSIFVIRNDSIKLVKQIGQNTFYGFFELNNNLYFSVKKNSLNQFEFWKTDGTSNGTFLLKSFPNHSEFLNFDNFITNGLYHQSFRGNDGKTHFIVTDGTTQGSTEIINHKIGESGYAQINNNVYFPASDGGQYWYRFKLWKSEGDSTSTQLALAEIEGDMNYGISTPFILNNELYLFAASNNQNKIHKFDPISSTTISITPAISNTAYQEIIVKNQKIYYSLGNTNSIDVFENSGTLASNSPVFSVPATFSDFFKLFVGTTKKYLFQQKISNGKPDGDVIIWVYDGLTLQKMNNIMPNLVFGIYNNVVNIVGDVLYFSASDGQHGYELWRTDGTLQGTFLVKDINNNIASSFPKIMFSLGNFLYFMANDISHGNEIWRTDGINTELYADFNQYNSQSHTMESIYTGKNKKFKNSHYANINYKIYKFNLNNTIEILHDLSSGNLEDLKDTLYFQGADNNLWKSDGTITGTKKAVHLDSTNNGTGNFGISFLTKADTLLFFTSNYGKKLWRTNGSKNGTVKLIEFQDSELSNDYFSNGNNGMRACKNKLFFERYNKSLNIYELWVSDGTIDGTLKLTSNYLAMLECFNNKLYYRTANDQLWQSDGTILGTIKTHDSGYYYYDARTLRNKLYFTTWGLNYYELDKTNNINLLKTITDHGNGNSYTGGEITNIDNRYLLNYILNSSTQRDYSFYLTDGNIENTKKSFSLKNPFPLTGRFDFTYLNKKIYFNAKDSLRGQEIWIWDFECPEGYTERDSIGKDSTIVYAKYIWGQNVLHNNKNVVYEAKNSITLQPGFEVKQGTVFRTNLNGCINNNSNNTETHNISKNNVLSNFIEPKKTYPQLIDFLNYQPNSHITQKYELFYRNREIPITWNISTEDKVYRLEFIVGEQKYLGYLPKK